MVSLRTQLVAAVAAAAFASSVAGQEAARSVQPHPGDVGVELAREFPGHEPTVQIRLNRTMLRVIGAAIEMSPEVGNVVQNLEFVHVVIYEDLAERETACRLPSPPVPGIAAHRKRERCNRSPPSSGSSGRRDGSRASEYPKTTRALTSWSDLATTTLFPAWPYSSPKRTSSFS